MSINGRQKFGIKVKRNGKLPCLDIFTTRTSRKISRVVCGGFRSKKRCSYDWWSIDIKSRKLNVVVACTAEAGFPYKGFV
jgi:hypothetical protein